MGARAPSKSWMTAEPQVVCPKMVPIFSFAQCEWATFGVRSPALNRAEVTVLTWADRHLCSLRAHHVVLGSFNSTADLMSGGVHFRMSWAFPQT